MTELGRESVLNVETLRERWRQNDWKQSQGQKMYKIDNDEMYTHC